MDQVPWVICELEMDQVCTHALLKWGIVAYRCTPPHCVTFTVDICFNCIISAQFKPGKLHQQLLLWTKIQSNVHVYYSYYVKFLCAVHYCISYLMMWCINKVASLCNTFQCLCYVCVCDPQRNHYMTSLIISVHS